MKSAKKVRIFVIYIIVILLIAVVAVVAAVRIRSLGNGIRGMQEITEEYIDSQKAVHSMREASDFLTQQTREYVVTGDEEHLAACLEEINETRRRELALEVLNGYQAENAAYQSLVSAVDSSNALAQTEMYAMRMTAEAVGMSDEDLNRYFGDIRLSEEDSILSAEEKRAKAVSLVFSDDYDRMKTDILDASFDSLEKLVEDTRTRQLESFQMAVSRLRQMQVMFIVILGASLFALLLTAFLIILPLTRSVRYIRKAQPLPLKGAAEYVYLAETYNGMLQKNREHQEQLSFDATHDELTGLYNRKVFEEVRGEEDDIAMLLVDVDHFKEINDTYGHETGDRVLQKIARILSSAFRSEDYVCRIGGDEFAVIMKHMNPGLKEVIQTKISAVRSHLAEKSDLPAITLSIGAAFSVTESAESGGSGISDAGAGESGGTDAGSGTLDGEGAGSGGSGSGEGGSAADGRDDVFRRADAALYKVKEGGRDGFAFYEPGDL